MKLMIGTLFVQCLTIVFRWCLSNRVQFEGVQWVLHQVHQLIYYPIMAVAVISDTLWRCFRDGLVLIATVGCPGESHYCWSSLFWFIKGCKTCTVIWTNTYPCWFTLAHFSSQLQWFIWCRWNCSESYKPRLGEVSEWFKVIDSKSIVRLCVPGVRIPPSPPHILPCESNQIR